MEEELTLVTKEILERTKNLKESTMNSMTVGDIYIVKGIIILEEIVKSINPTNIDDELIDRINRITNQYLLKRSSKHSNYLRFGIFNALLMLENYKKEYIFGKKRK